jgi:hypothetical protein
MMQQQMQCRFRIRLALCLALLAIQYHAGATEIERQESLTTLDKMEILQAIQAMSATKDSASRSVLKNNKRSLRKSAKSNSPTSSPAPSTSPTSYPTQTSEPTPEPTELPSFSPTKKPSFSPTKKPSSNPTLMPTSRRPVSRPTTKPQPIRKPVVFRTSSQGGSLSPTIDQTEYPSAAPNTAPFTSAQFRNGNQPWLTPQTLGYPNPPTMYMVNAPVLVSQPPIYYQTQWQPPTTWQPPVAYYPPWLMPATTAPVSLPPTYSPIRAPSGAPSTLPTSDFFPDRPVAPVAWWETPPKPSPVTWQELNPAAAAATQNPTALFNEQPSSWWLQPQVTSPSSVMSPNQQAVSNKAAVQLANFTMEFRTTDGDFSISTLTELLEEYFYSEMLFTNLYKVTVAVLQTEVSSMKESMLSKAKIAGVAYFDTKSGITTVPTFENLRTEQAYVLMDYKSLQTYFDEFFLFPGNGHVVTLVQTSVDGIQNPTKIGSKKRMSGGATAGTTIATLFVVFAIAGGIYYYLRIWRVRKRDDDLQDQSAKPERRSSKHPSLTSQSDGSSEGKTEEKPKRGSKWRPILHSEYSSDDDIVKQGKGQSTVKKYLSARRTKRTSASICSDSVAGQSIDESAFSEVPTSICAPPKTKTPSIELNSAKTIFEPQSNLNVNETYESVSASSSADFTNQTEPSGDYTTQTGTLATDFDIQTISQFDPDAYSIYTEHLIPPEKTLKDSNLEESIGKSKTNQNSEETSPLNTWGEDTEDL